ncbi:hypothetical protein [Haladaptatus sp. YSMS36]|uniref:hypothetical protein n=1 Tax=Haladaptatus sp. YSMS36 TaxID=3033384 RepID=UPI0023E8F73F|nr:hypothetical protein [Haladaptatus sp. YSMS36]
MNALLSQIDEKSRLVLEAIEYYGGEATLSEIRRRTGLSRSETNHRFRKLNNLRLIEISHAETGYGNRSPPKVASLTGRARGNIDRILIAGTPNNDCDTSSEFGVDREAFEDLVVTMERLERRVDTLTHGGGSTDTAAIRDEDDQLNARITELESKVGRHTMDEKFVKRVQILEEGVVELEDEVYDWMGTVETYLRALRLVVEENCGVSMTSYFGVVENADE